MSSPQTIAGQIQQAFEYIERERMAGIPILNPMIRVETLGFKEYDGRVMGVVLTPWMMNLVMLPAAEDEWDRLELGSKQPYDFPCGSYTFMVNEIDGIGRCLTYSLYSPMNEFANQDHALAAASAFLDTLMVERDPNEPPPVDETLLGRIMRGEETPEINLDDYGDIGPGQPVGPKCSRRSGIEREAEREKALTRRDLLRGNLLRGD